jgi:arylsulfatase A-like enzyme
VFALTADHGVAPIPEVRAQREHVPAVRVSINPPLRAISDRLRAAGVDTTPLGFEEGVLILNRAAIGRTKLKLDSVVNAVAVELRAVPGVQRVDLMKDLAKADTTKDYVARRWIHMIPSDFPVDLVVTLAPYAYYGDGSVSTHGTPHDYDAHVPVVFYGPAFKSGKFTDAVKVVDIAPTLAAVIGVRPTETLDGRVRTEAIR